MEAMKNEKEQVAHMVTTLLNLDEGNPLQKAFSHMEISSLAVILGLRAEDVDELHHLNSNSNRVDLFRWMKSCIYILQQCNFLHQSQYHPIEDWMNVTQEEIAEFCISPNYDPCKNLLSK
jgi:hypothetical protein